MHELLMKYITDGLDYIDNDRLVAALKKVDNSYFIDDLNFLTMSSNIDCLCGYFPETDFTRNFCYLCLRNKNWQIDPMNIEPISPDRLYISCRDLNVVERYLDFCYKNRLFKKIALNVPIRFVDVKQSAVEALPKLLAKYSGYYKLASQIFDYRFLDIKSPLVREDIPYKIETDKQDIFGDNVPIHSDWYVLKKRKPILAYGCDLYYNPERIGTKCFSFSNSFYSYEDETIKAEDALIVWTYLAKKYLSDGYVVKGIAINEGFDSDEMYIRMGMEKYRCFFRLTIDK